VISNLVAEEVHGITQEVRTRAVALQDPTIDDRNRLILTLIDTPGQEIFYRMRNTGAQVANLGVLLVSIDDGVSLLSLTFQSLDV
jgi:translation initiation factor IF-2